LVECKYHNRHGLRSDLKVAHYTQSRFADVVRGDNKNKNEHDHFHQAWLVTNTQYTSEAIAYAKCMGLKIWAWRYPKHRGLEHYIEQKHLSITILPSLSGSVLERLSHENIILASDLFAHSAAELVSRFGVPEKVARAVSSGVTALCAK